jgi:hypothetical protein
MVSNPYPEHLRPQKTSRQRSKKSLLRLVCPGSGVVAESGIEPDEKEIAG